MMAKADDRHPAKQPIAECVKRTLAIYFEDLDGHQPHAVYELVLSQTEKPMLESVMKHTKGNLTKAAEILGLNRLTVQRKLKKYGLDQRKTWR